MNKLLNKRCRHAFRSWLAITLLSIGCVPNLCMASDFFGLTPGIRAGGSMSRLQLNTTPDGIQNNFHPGFMVGATLAYDALPIVGLEIQAMYIEQGGELEGSIDVFGETFEGKAKFKVAYLTIPMLANFKMSGVTTRPYAKLGPQFGYRISANVEAADDTGLTVDNDIKEDTNSIDWSLYFAAGLEFPLTTVAAYVEVGYSFGIVDLFKVDQNLGEPVNAKNHVLAITAGLSY